MKIQAEIKQIKKFAGDYILKTDKTKLTINTQVIDKKSLAKLNKARIRKAIFRNKLKTALFLHKPLAII